jgi:hypothetical protein
MGPNGESGWVEGESYDAKVVRAWTGTSRVKATPFIAVRFEATSGDMAGETIDHEMYVTEGRKEALRRELEMLGFKVANGADWDNLLPTINSAECSISVKSETYQGNTRTRVDSIRAKGAGKVNEGGGGIVGIVAAMFGGVVSKPKTGEGDVDNVPF